MKKLKIDISFVYYIVTIIFVLIVLYFLQSNKTKEGMDNPEQYRIVVAKYQKDVSFLDETGIPYTVITKEEVPNCKLSTLAEFFGTKTEPNHRALDDAKATTEILHGLLERLGSFKVSTVDQLMEFAKKSAHIHRQSYWGLSSI